MKLSAIVVLLVAGANSPAMGAPRSPVFTPQQKQAIVEAYRLGGLRFAAIIYQESSGCAFLHGKLDPYAFGCSQLHHDTADGIAGAHVSTHILMHDYDLNLHIGAEQLRRCTVLFGKFGGITCYNAGIPVARRMTPYQRNHSPYLHAIERRIRELKALPLSTE